MGSFGPHIVPQSESMLSAITVPHSLCLWTKAAKDNSKVHLILELRLLKINLFLSALID